MNDDMLNVFELPFGSNDEAKFKERAFSKGLLFSNPNYFGNLAKSEFKAVFPIVENTFYEELACVGYQSQQEYLEAVVYVYQSFGYGTRICGTGTSEFVRFYLSFDGGSTWDDQGLTSFQAFNIPEADQSERGRLEYAVSLKVDPKRKFCFVDDHLIQVRAILSWNFPPPANTPNWKPVWGNVEDATIQVEPLRLFSFPLLAEQLDVQLPSELINTISPETLVPTQKVSLSPTQLSKISRSQDIPVSRFAFKELSALISENTISDLGALQGLFPAIKIDPDLLQELFPVKDGDTSYEELVCIGLDPNNPNTLVGIIHIKRQSGYSGGPCTDGSLEYVTFWADTDNNGDFETYLGTSSVQVYDLRIPDKGVYYAVRLPVNLAEFQQRCENGPSLMRIRAILSWNVAPPSFNSNYVPRWGNREETVIHIPKLISAPAGKLAIVGGIPVEHINDISGLTTADAVFATNNLAPDSLRRPCPFARRITIQGAPLVGDSYKIEVMPVGSSLPTPVVNDLIVTNQFGITTTHSADPSTGRFQYLSFADNINSVLGQWDSTGNDLWIVKLTTFDSSGSVIGIDTHRIQLKNTGPIASVEITSGSGDCGKFSVGTTLQGRFVARDEVLAPVSYLSTYNLSVEPNINGAGIGIPSPSSGMVNTSPSPGDTWSLNTAGMQACGYIIRVRAFDRTIVNSQSVGLQAGDSAGLCLE